MIHTALCQITLKKIINRRHSTGLRNDNVSAICIPSPFSLSVIYSDIKLLHLQNNEKSILDWNIVRFFSWLSWGHTFLADRRSCKRASTPDVGACFWFRSKSLGWIQISSWEMAGFACSDSFECFQYATPTCKESVLVLTAQNWIQWTNTFLLYIS